MSRTFSKKLLYVVVVLSVLAMMIPAAMPVSAAGGSLSATLVQTGNSALPQYTYPTPADADGHYNVFGSTIRVAVTGDSDTVRGFSYPGVNGTPAPTLTQINEEEGWVELTSINTTETQVTAAMNDNTTVGTYNKKWGAIAGTVLTPASGSQYVTWNEDTNEWFATTTFSDTVNGTFNTGAHVAQGAILNWYLVDGAQSVPIISGEAAPGHDYDLGLCGAIADLAPARYAKITGSTSEIQGITGTWFQTVTDATGVSGITVTTTGEESIKVVVVPEYPGDPQIPTTIEVANYNFMTYEMEVVPQVRWAGEKTILEANFGEVGQESYVVKFSLSNDSPGSLTSVYDFDGPGGLNMTNTTLTVWAGVDPVTGLFPVALESQNPGQVDVDATLYAVVDGDMVMVSQEAFTVFYLKLESLTLSDVVGKRVLTDEGGVIISHKDGMWTEGNPWNIDDDYEYVNSDDPDNDTLNVSQDALLRARVKGWFENSNPTTRPESYVAISKTAPYDLILPAGRYVLPDDWDLLAGYAGRIHWDIMCDPSQATILGVDPMGPYYANLGPKQAMVAAADVVGPFAPSLELMTDTGWAKDVVSTDPMRDNKTVVPDTLVNAYDAPMPPAKIIFEIESGVGFFKDADKCDIYYMNLSETNIPEIVYTNPFYYAYIPAHELIPPTVGNGGYDWNSFGFGDNDSDGAYDFWHIINQPTTGVPVAGDPTGDFPTKVEVYSDNHGEAMVYLNGDANLFLKGNNGGADIVFGTEVGQTVVQAWADYPYYRKHQAIYGSYDGEATVPAEVTKHWLWGGMTLGNDPNIAGDPAPMVLLAGTDTTGADYITLDNGYSWNEVKDGNQDDATGKSNKHVVWLWLTDRDGFQAGVMDAQVEWSIDGAGSWFYNGGAISGINPHPTSSHLAFDGKGFLAGTNGTRANGVGVTTGVSSMRAPTTYEKVIFNKFWGDKATNPVYGADGEIVNPDNFVVAAIDIISQSSGTVSVYQMITSGDYAFWSADNMQYFTSGTIQRETDFATTDSYPLDDPILLGDANSDGEVNMMDITAVERIILGMDQVVIVNADANYNNVIDMGDVIRIEKTYLGLK